MINNQEQEQRSILRQQCFQRSPNYKQVKFDDQNYQEESSSTQSFQLKLIKFQHQQIAKQNSIQELQKQIQVTKENGQRRFSFYKNEVPLYPNQFPNNKQPTSNSQTQRIQSMHVMDTKLLKNSNNKYRFDKFENSQQYSIENLQQNKQYFQQYQQFIKQKEQIVKKQEQLKYKVLPKIEQIPQHTNIEIKDQKLIVSTQQIENFQIQPNSRDAAAYFSNDNLIYIHGGVGQRKFNDFHVFDINNFEWKTILKNNDDFNNKQKTNEQQSDKKRQSSVSQINLHMNQPRYGHSLIVYKNCAYIFGGVFLNDKKRIFNNNLIEINLQNQQAILLDQKNQYVKERYNHQSCLLDKYMIIHGGQYGKQVLSDLLIWDLVNKSWVLITLGSGIELSNHSLTVIYHNDNKKLELSTTHELYVFGGHNTEMKENNNVYTMNFDLETFNPQKSQIKRFEKIQTQGTPPCSRFAHSSSFLKNMYLIVIYGGQDSKNNFFDDIHILNLKNHNWMEIEVYNFHKIKRSHHYQQCYNDQIYIYGGLNEDGYINLAPYKIQIDNKKNQQLNYLQYFNKGKKTSLNKHNSLKKQDNKDFTDFYD